MPPRNSTLTVIYESDDFTFSNQNPPPPQNIELAYPLSDFSDLAVIHFYLRQKLADGGRSTEKETDIMALKDLPVITDTEFTAANTRNTHAIEIPRIINLNNTRAAGGSLLLIGKKSDTELRISCSHPLVVGGRFCIKVVEFLHH